jgi:hypothetical protein
LAAFNLDFYTDVQDLSYLQEYLDRDPRSAKYRYFSDLFGDGLCWILIPPTAVYCNGQNSWFYEG